MTHLYNMHTEGAQYRCTKFDSLGNVESSYLCTDSTCECPAGRAPTCRHRQMLPKFIAREAVNTFWFYDYDRSGWVTNESGMNIELRTQAEKPAPNITATEIDERMSKLQAPQVDVSDMLDAMIQIAKPAKPWRRI